MSSTLVDQSECLRRAATRERPVLLCAFSGSSSPCGGDSGGALVLNDADARPRRRHAGRLVQRQLERLLRGRDRARDPRSSSRATTTRRWRRAPTSTTTLERPTAVMQVGQTVTLHTRASGRGGPDVLVRVPSRAPPAPWFGAGRRPPTCSATGRRAARSSAACSRRTTAARRFDESASVPTPVENAPELAVAADVGALAAGRRYCASGSSTGSGRSARSTSA